MIQVRWCTCKDGWQKHASMIEFNHIFVLFDQNGDLARHIREIKIQVYRQQQTSDLSWEFLRIEHKQIKTVPNDSYG